MALTERKICEYISSGVAEIINDFLNGIVKVEIDTYFTRTPLATESFSAGMTSYDELSYGVFANDVPELGTILKNYRSITITSNTNDYEGKLHTSAGAGKIKYAHVDMKNILYSQMIGNLALEKFNPSRKYWKDEALYTYIHEFIHTIDESDLGYQYHDAIDNYYDTNESFSYEISRKFLLGQLEKDGEPMGIQIDYWLGKCDVQVNYVPSLINFRSPGKVIIVGGEEPPETWINYITIKVPFGSSITVEAVPYEGFKFSHWSDGVKTARRTDTNIISLLTVKAIFVDANGKNNLLTD